MGQAGLRLFLPTTGLQQDVKMETVPDKAEKPEKLPWLHPC